MPKTSFPMDCLKASFLGVCGALAFPLVIPSLGPLPVLDGLPRELGAYICAGGMFQIANSNRSAWVKFRCGLSAGVPFFAILLYWLTIAMGEFGGMPGWQILPVFSLLVVYCSLYWGLATLVLHRIEGGRVVRAVTFASGWVVLEWARGIALTGFPWGNLGYSQARVLPLVQWASIGGVSLVAFLVVLGGIVLWTYAELRRSTKVLKAGGVLALYALVIWGGGEAMLRSDREVSEERLVGIVQGNIEQSIKNRSPEHRKEIIGRYYDGSVRALKAGVELLVWPEAAWPGYLNTRLKRFPIAEFGVPLLVGAPAFDVGDERRHFNSVFWVDADGSIVSRHDKNHLVPFGEYVPLRWLLPVNRFVPGLIDFSAGESMAPLGVPPAGILICFDGVFPELAREATIKGASWLVNMTNDGWYGVSSAPYQHRDFYVFRAAENRRWVVRAANTGVSAIIDHFGRIRHETDLNQETVLSAAIQLRRERSFYFYLGEWWLLGAGLFLVWANRKKWLGLFSKNLDDGRV